MAKKTDKSDKKQQAEKKSSEGFKPGDQKLDITVNSFGEILQNYDIDAINQFLNENLEDKKIKNRKDKNQE
ncbi:MAG TPA: hypothetical protein DCM08_07430 [Microscillaceae bacterium]|jgi:hypothetical protein|nr:hypothetical protein [Microscillaceae bacterium]